MEHCKKKNKLNAFVNTLSVAQMSWLNKTVLTKILVLL